MKDPHNNGSKSHKNGAMGSASESQIFASGTPGGSVRRMSDPRRESSESTIFHSTRSEAADSVSRFPYHTGATTNRSSGASRRRKKNRSSPERIRSSRSSESPDPENRSLEFTTLVDADSPGGSSTDESRRPVVPVGRLDRSNNDNNSNLNDNSNRNLDRSNTDSMLLDESGVSLMLQESTTFPDSYAPQSSCWNFAIEHRIFLKAVLELIAERDKVATEVGMNDPNIIKSGALKKASHLMKGAWKVKYVEIRRGMFSYYEDAVSGRLVNNSMSGANASAELQRKNIPLEANACQCRAVRLHQKALTITPRGAIFELAISGRPKRLWMANSREERQAWIQAIHDAMVGGSVTRGGNPAQNPTVTKSGGVDSRSPHKEDVKRYQKVQRLLRNSKSKDDYVRALRQIYRYDLSVPVKWIAKQAEQENKGTGSGGTGDVKGAFHEEDVKSSVDQLFKDLQRDTIKIDDEIYKGNSGHAPERIMGALARRIMLCGRRNDVSYEGDDERRGESHRHASKYDMSESQALAYARDVLLSGNRTRSGGDSYFCVNTLCKNDDLIVLVPSSTEAEPVSITVTRDTHDDDLHQDTYARSGWLRTRRRTRNPWVKAYFELSEGTLSYYEHASPRPHGLQGQLSILDANILIEQEDQKSNNGEKLFILTIVPKDKAERQLLLEGEERLVVWAYALECSAKSKGGAPAPLMKAMRSLMARMPKVPAAVNTVARRASMGAIGVASVAMGGMGSGGGARSSLMDDNSNKDEDAGTAEAALKKHVASLGLDISALEERLAAYASQQSAWVKASIEASTVYKVCTLDPDGDENEDTWAVVDATFLQEFRVTGGPNPRIMRGEELVKLDVTRCPSIPAPPFRRASTQDERVGGTPMARLIRTFSDEVEYRGSKTKEKE